MKKYKLLEKEKNGLHRIQALRDFGDVKKGDLGGLVESEENLSHEGVCWIYGKAQVFGNARVFGNAWIYGKAWVFENAWVSGNAEVYGNARVSGNAKVYENAWVYENAKVYGKAKVYEDAKVYGEAKVYENAKVYGNALVSGNARVFENAEVYGNAWVFEDAIISGEAKVYENAIVYENARVSGNAKVYENARVSGNAKVYGEAKVYGDFNLKFGEINFPLKTFKEKEYIFSSLGVLPENGKYTLYKRVDKISKGKYCSLHDSSFLYEDGKIAEEKNYDSNVMKSCSRGLHVSTPDYWHKGNTLIQVEVKVEDIITCQEGKLRVKKLKVVKELSYV